MKRNTFLYALLLMVICSGVYAKETISFAIVPQFDARQLRATWLPIIDKIENITRLKVDLVQSPSIPEFESRFSNGEFDFVYLNPYHLVVANQHQGYYPILKDRASKLKGIIVVRSDSQISTVKELKDATIAFPAPNALGASLLNRSDLRDTFNINFTPKYVGNHDSVYLNVLLGLTQAGGGVYGTLRQQKAEIRNGLRVLHETRSTPKHPIAVHPRVSVEVVEKIKNALLVIAKSEDGKLLLKNIPIKDLGSASLSEYLVLRDLGLNTLLSKKK